MQERLRRDAAAEQAGAAEPVVALDEGDALAELGGAQGGGVPAGPASDHGYVVGITHPTSQATAGFVGVAEPGRTMPGVDEHRSGR